MKTRQAIVFFLFGILIFFSPLPGHACTTFVIDNGEDFIFGRNYDWMFGDGLVIVNKRGVEKTIKGRLSEVEGVLKVAQYDEKSRLSWRSKYASITFNQFGCEVPMGGMNEAGLVVELLWLAKTRYPKPDPFRHEVGELNWIQYQLDNYSTIEEVIDSDAKIRIKPNSIPIHFLVSDRTGKSVSIEFLKGEMVYHTGERLPVKVLANSTYSESYQFLTTCKGFGGTAPIPTGQSSLERFARAASLLKEYDKETSKSIVPYGFDILKNVAEKRTESETNESTTQWSIVYDVRSLRVYFRTRTHPEIRYVDLRAFDLSCKTPKMVLDINANRSGDLAGHFKDYTWKINRKLIGSTFSKAEFLSKWPKEILDWISHIPDAYTFCGQ